MAKERSQSVPNKATGKEIDWKAVEAGVIQSSDQGADNRGKAEIEPPKISADISFYGVKLPPVIGEAYARSPHEDRLFKMLEEDSFKGLEARAELTSILTGLARLREDVLENKKVSEAPTRKRQILDGIHARIKELRGQYEEKLKESPEAFMAAHVADLRKHYREYKRGRIVQTEYVQDKLAEIGEALATSRMCFISGETGTGKTEAARIAARNFSGKKELVIRGYAGIGATEIYGHMTLTDSSEKRMENARKEIDLAEQVYVEKFPDASPEDLAAVARGVLQKGGVTTTEYILGAVYQAAKEGRVVIIDEANYIPTELLASLNDIMTKRKGEAIDVQQDGVGPITVQEGFGIIFTGNVNPPSGPMAKRYIGRREFDAAFTDRVPLVEYGHLPQAIKGIPSDHAAADKQLFTVAITTALLPAASGIGTIEKLENRYGAIFLPGGERGGLNALWRFSQFASVTQRAFAGEFKDGDAGGFQSGESNTAYIPKVQLSNRGVMRVIEKWRDDGLKYELDYYIARDIFARATDPKDRAYLYQQAQLSGFFRSEGWEQNPDYSPKNLPKFEVKIPKNEAAGLELVPAREVIASIYGDIPIRTVWPDGAGTEVQKNQNDVAEFIAIRTEFDTYAAELDKKLEPFVSTNGL
jgi:MoxR-like ATPase